VRRLAVDLEQKMSPDTTRQIGAFIATSQDGAQHDILIFQTFQEALSRAGKSVRPGRKHLETTDGHKVNRIDKGKYEIAVFPAISLSSDDPTAP
jgi:hypothetical protein